MKNHRPGRLRGVWSAALLCAVLAAAGCGGSSGEARDRAVDDATALLASDPSAALFHARDALGEAEEAHLVSDGRLELVAAQACLRLERRSEALEYATNGLAAADLDEDLRSDLFFVRGSALMGRYRELNDETDWRSANSALERATEHGHRRIDAAMALVGLQDLGNHANPERQLKYGRLVIALDQQGDKATLVKRLLESKGLQP